MNSVIQLEIDQAMLWNNVEIETPMCKFDGVDGFEWSVVCQTREVLRRYPHLILKVKRNNFNHRFSCDITAKSPNGKDRSFSVEIDHADLRPYIVNGRITFNITATCVIPFCHKTDATNAKLQLQPFEIVEKCDDLYDLKIVTEKDNFILAHKGFLLTMSPVFNAMFTHNTKESQTGVIEIKDFDHATVKSAINLLYGHLLEPKSIQDVVGVLRFAEKYIIKTVVIHFETWLNENITVDNFDCVVKHAWDHSSDKLKEICARFYRQHIKPELRDVNPDVVADMARLSLS
uniref:BTB domain-containing protein n=1 Tax=Panagrellus redivivus TaxID=6233 RepID=A0A7E4WD69_PANRE